MDIERQGTSRHLSLIFLIIAIVIIVIISLTSYLHFKKLVQNGNWVEHTYQVLITTLQISDSMSYIESRQRAYLLFDDKEFNNEYDKTITFIKNKITDLKKMVADNPIQKQRAELIQSLIEKRLVVLNELLDFKQNKKLGSQAALLVFTEGRALSTQLRQNIAQFFDEENRLLKIRDDTVERQVNAYNIILLIGQGLSILFLILAFLMMMRNKRKVSIMENQLWGIVNSAKDIIVAIDPKMQFIIFNKTFKEDFFKIFNKEIKPGMKLDDALSNSSDEQRDKVYDIWKESFTANKPYSKTVEFNINDEINTYEIYSNKIFNQNELLGAVHITRNVTERIKEKSELERINRRLQATSDELTDKNEKISLLLEMSDVMLATNTLKELSTVTTKYASQILTLTSGCVYVMHSSKNLLESSSIWGKLLSTTTHFTPDECWSLRLGKIYYASKKVDMACGHVGDNIYYLCVPLRAQNDIFGVLYIEFKHSDEDIVLSKNNKIIIGAFAEIAALALANISLRESLKYQSTRDPLTSLYNRRYLEEFLYKLISQSERNHQSIAIMMLDIDHFKRINDIYGHDAGDLVLKEFSKLLINEIRPGDIVARFGGEEFVIVLYNTKIDDAVFRANKIRKKVSALSLKYGAGHVGKITVSIGVSSYPTCGTTSKVLIEAADKALYVAKNSGRDKVVSFEHDKSLTSPSDV